MPRLIPACANRGLYSFSKQNFLREMKQDIPNYGALSERNLWGYLVMQVFYKLIANQWVEFTVTVTMQNY